MKKLMVALVAVATMGLTGFAETTACQADVYTFKMSLKFPELKAGVRKNVASVFKGTLTMEYGDGEGRPATAIYATVVNNRTKATHEIVFGEGWTVLFKKASIAKDYAMSGQFLEGGDVRVTTKAGVSVGNPEFGDCDVVFGSADSKHEADIAHETLKQICLAGFGKIKKVKTSSGGCSSCGILTTDGYCRRLQRFSGNVVGAVDCECPEDIDWYHTVKFGLCGGVMQFLENGDVAELKDYRTHTAPTYGSWAATYKQTITVYNEAN